MFYYVDIETIGQARDLTIHEILEIQNTTHERAKWVKNQLNGICLESV